MAAHELPALLKSAREAFEVSEERFHSLVQTATDAIICSDASGKITFWNRAAERIFGYERAEVMGKPIKLIMPQKFREAHESGLRRLATTGESRVVGHTVELMGRKKSGREFPIELSLSSWKIDGAAYFAAIIHDITARKAIESKLEANRKQLAVTLRSIGDGVITTDVEGRVALLNRVAEELTGWPQAEAVGKPLDEVFNIINEKTRRSAPNPVKKVLKTGSVVGLANQTALISKDGVERSIADSCAAIRDNDGTVFGAVLVFRDITEEKLAQEELDKSRERAEDLSRSLQRERDILQVIMENTEANLAYLDRDFNFVAVNSTFERGCGHKSKELIGRNHFEFFPDAENQAIFKRVRETGQAVEFKAKPFEFVDQPWRGATYWDWTLTPIKDEGGGVRGLVLSLLDVTEAIRAKQLSEAVNEINAHVTSTLDVEEIIDRAVVKAAEVLGCETAGVGMREGSHWVVTSGYRLPPKTIGRRFTDEEAAISTLIVETGKPVVINDARADGRVHAPSMARLGLRSVLAAPLVVKDEIIAIMSFNHNSTAVSYTEAQVDFVTKLAVSVSMALENARLYAAEHKVAETLQETMLTIPTAIVGLEFGHIYRSATETAKVGGDFYDLFELEHDRVGIVIGDVAGKGLKAAALTMLIKNTIKAYAYENLFPASIMAKTNDVIRRAVTSNSDFVSVFFGILDKKTGHFTYCSGGHPPSVLQRADGTLEWLAESSPIVGAFSNLSFNDAATMINPGDRLILYTDGVTEARRANTFFGEEGLMEAIRGKAKVPVERLPQLIFDQVNNHTGGTLADDLAMLALSIRPVRP